jgi:histidinol-phosphate aminotransferase
MRKNLMRRKTLEDFKQYTAEVHFNKIRYDEKFKQILKLDGNENLFISPKYINTLIKSTLEEIKANLYTDTTCEDLREAIAKHFSFKMENVMVGNGADGILDTIVKTYLDHNLESIVVEPTYSIYKFFINIMGAKYKPVLLNNNFTLNTENIIKAITKKTRIIFFGSPNNPTGNQFDYYKVIEILNKSNCIIVVDEAYAEYGKYSLIPALRNYNNLIIVKTMSKAYGLASLRAGYCISNLEIIKEMLKITPPYPVNIVAQKIIPKILSKKEIILKIVNNVKKERKYLIYELAKFDNLEPYQSDSNFILFRVKDKSIDAYDLHKKLLEKGVIVRNRSTLPLLDNCLRITIGPREINDAFLKRLTDVLS